MRMAEIAPLTPLRFDTNRIPLDRVVAPPYDVIDEEGRKELEARHPENVVRLILPRGEGDAKYETARETLADWKNRGVLVRDDEPAFYRYDQTFSPPGGGPRATRRGFLALVRTQPFADRIILPHERTLSGPKEDRLKLFRATKTNLSPGFMLYRDPRLTLDAPLESGHVISEFSTEDGIHHALAKVTSRDAIETVVKTIKDLSLLIADGHHRYETSLRYSGEIDAANPGALPRAAHHYFMVFLCNEDDPNLKVFATHRHIHDLPKARELSWLEQARDLFHVERLGKVIPAAELLKKVREKGDGTPAFGFVTKDESVVLTLKSDAPVDEHPVLKEVHPTLRRTDVVLLHRAILEHLLGITLEAQAAKTNLWYPQDGTLAQHDLASGKGDALFLLNPTPVTDVRRVAEAGEVMPQKATFFFPKVLTGLAIHTLEADRIVAS